MPNKPVVSIIVPTYNRSLLLPLTLDSMLAQDYPADRFEIVIGDNNSSDGTQTVLEEYARRDPRVRPFFEPRQGVHYVRNRAACLSKGEILYFTDDDMIADPALLRHLVTAFEDAQVGTATGKVLPHWETPPPDWVKRCMINGLLSLQDLGNSRKFSDVDLGVYSCHQAIRRDVFFQSGGFNPENTAGVWIGDGETGLNIKIRELGFRFGYIPESIIYHIIPPYRLTQRYLNTRLANQGNCDSYTDYRRYRYTATQLVEQILRHIAGSRNSMLGNLLKVPWRFFVRRNHDGARMALGSFFYYCRRIAYDVRLLHDSSWRNLVLRNDWLEQEICGNK